MYIVLHVYSVSLCKALLMEINIHVYTFKNGHDHPAPFKVSVLYASKVTTVHIWVPYIILCILERLAQQIFKIKHGENAVVEIMLNIPVYIWRIWVKICRYEFKMHMICLTYADQSCNGAIYHVRYQEDFSNTVLYYYIKKETL